MNEILDAALEYAERGWAVFPISRDKTPLTPHGFKDASTDPNVIREWWRKKPSANVAIATGKMSGGLVVIDLDVDYAEGKDGISTLDIWTEENGCWIDSRTVITGRGGKHIYFQSSEAYGCKIGAMKDIDIRGEGGYVVAPPSIHKNGNSYYWDEGLEEDEIISVDHDSDVKFFLYECFKDSVGEEKKKLEIPTEVTTGGRNDMIFKVASSLQSQGSADDVIMNTCKAYNLASCHPPLEDDEVERTVLSALKYEKGTAKKTENVEEVQKKKEEELKNKTYRKLKKAQDLMSKELKEPRVIIGVGEEVPFLVEGTCILSAKPKLGKSWLALDMCLAVSKGEDFLGYKTNKCSTLYLDLETSEQLQQKRMRKALNGSEMPDNFYLETETDNLDNGFVNQIESYMKEDPNIGLVIVDVFQVIRSKAVNSKEDAYNHTYRDITPLNQLAQKYHISIILVCHDRKAVDPDDPFSNILGSIGLQGAATQMIVMFKKRKDLPIHISVKGKTIDGLPDLDVNLDGGVWTKVEAGNTREIEQAKRIEDYMQSEIRQAVLKILEASSSFKGSCSGIISEAVACGVGMDADALDVGKFLSKNQSLFMKYDTVMVEIINNGTGPKRYKLSKCTIDTIDGTVHTIDENAGNPFV